MCVLRAVFVLRACMGVSGIWHRTGAVCACLGR
jgi:hypothetical protein